MSDLQRSFAKAKLVNFPAEPPYPPLPSGGEREDEDEVETDDIAPLPKDAAAEAHLNVPTSSAEDDSSSASSGSSTGTVKPEPRKGRFAKPSRTSSKGAIPWSLFFQQSNRYGPRDSAFTHHAYYTPPRSSSAPLFVLVHGAGASGLTFASLVRSVSEAVPEAGFLAPDLRGHGETQLRADTDAGMVEREKGDDGSLHVGLERLAADLEMVIQEAIKETREREGWVEMPGLVFVGHSLGGAVATRVAASERFKGKVQGLVVLDVVEGSAVDALAYMNTYLATRPTSFPSVEAGIEWHVRSRTIRNAESARISVPSYLSPNSPSSSSTPKFHFRTPLGATEPYWPTWFAGLSTAFLAAAPGAGKLLVLAGTDRLDTPLMVAQMQGKFQLAVVPDAGHFVHEDRPERVAEILVGFARRIGAGGESEGGPLIVNGKVIRGGWAGGGGGMMPGGGMGLGSAG